MNPITFRVVGEPKAQPRPRAFAKKFGDHYSARVYTPGTAEAWKGEIARVAEQHRPDAPFAGPLTVSLAFLFARPAGHYGTGRNAELLKPAAPADHLAKPDVDNLAKAAIDCLMQIAFFRDDGQVTDLRVTKRWAARDERHGVAITITPQGEPTPAAVPEPLFAMAGGAS